MSQIDIENKKLKKKMKAKDSKKKKRKGEQIEDIDEDDQEAPIVKVLANEMPEGMLEDSDGDENSKRSLNDPHRALDINLDE